MTSSLPTPSSPASPASFLPPDDPQRTVLHNEVHARPPARVRLPALVVQVAVLNAGITREDECAHLRRLSGQAELPLERLSGNFLRLPCGHFTVKWERHSEFTRYSIVQALPENAVNLPGNLRFVATEQLILELAKTRAQGFLGPVAECSPLLAFCSL